MKIAKYAIPFLLAFTAQLNATILAVCSEDINCVMQGTVNTVTTSGHYPTNSRLSNSVTGAGITSSRVQTNTFSSASSDFWMSAYFYQPFSGSTATTNFVGLAFLDGGTARLMLRTPSNSTTNQWQLSKRNAAGTYTDLGSIGVHCSDDTLCRVDIHVVYSTSGSVDVYSNGTLIISYSGDVTTDSATTLNQAEFASFANRPVEWSHVIASSTDTRSMILYNCAPNGAGATQAWTGSYTNVNPTLHNDATFNSTNSSNQLSQFTTGCTSIPSTVSISDVRQSARLIRGTSGPQTFRWSTHISGSDYDNGGDLSLATGFANYDYSWGVNSPATGVAWTASEINSGFSMGVKSRP